jgi:hypothetical protein
MPTKKQIRRQQKLKRHEYEEVYVDEEGRELDPEEAEQLIGAAPSPKAAKAAKGAQTQRSARGVRTVEPPSWRRTLRRGLLFFPLMFLTVHLIDSQLTWATKVTQTVVLMAFFLPFSYFMDTMMFRSYQRRLDRALSEGKKR